MTGFLKVYTEESDKTEFANIGVIRYAWFY